MDLSCRSCGHEWTWRPVLPVPLLRFAYALQALRCPRCGSGILGIRTTPTAPADPGNPQE